MKVLKFGGTSVASAPIILRVEQIVRSASRLEHVILVNSAISKCTDTLIKIGNDAAAGNEAYTELIRDLKDRHHGIIADLLEGQRKKDADAACDRTFAELEALAAEIFAAGVITPLQMEAVQAFGELLSTKIVAAKLAADGIRTLWIDSRAIIRTENGIVRFDLTNAAIRKTLDENPDIEVFVAPGFIASDLEGHTVTLGRGGSDYSAAIYAAGSNARILEIWTDVPGIMTSDPKRIPAAATIPYLSYRAAKDMADFGAKVLYPPTILPAKAAGIPICILNTYDPEVQGSLIMSNPPHRESGILGVSSTSYANFVKAAQGMQVPASDAADDDVVICLIGNKKIDNDSTLEKVGAALDKARIKPKAIFGSDYNAFAIVPETDARDAMRGIHRKFFETKPVKVINIFIAGYGAVGKAFAEMLESNGAAIEERSGKRLNIVGVSNSRRFVINAEGIRPKDIDTLLAYGQNAEGGAFFDALGSLALKNTVLVDCTNSESIGMRYEEFFRRGINVVSCNRRAFAVPYARYAAIKAAAHDYGLGLKYDTTVGASLPILESISHSSYSGDEITSIEAVISCTLNNIITGYDGANTESFATLLKKAQDIGLTETDPRLDLGGRDALRKLLILAREAGVALEESDVEITPMLGQEFFDCTLDEFYSKLAEYEPKFIEREKELDDMGMRQRFVASVRKDPEGRLGYKAEIKMQLVGVDSPFYWISGTENVTVIRSQYSAPMVIKGAGEGARMAASGVLNNILTL